MASFSRSQKLRQASVAERIAALQVQQEAEADKLQKDLREKQARERAELEELLKREAKTLEMEEEKRRRSAERKRREVENQEIEGVPGLKKARLFCEQQQTWNFKNGQTPTGSNSSTSMVRSSNAKKKLPPTEPCGAETGKHRMSDGVEENEVEQERVSKAEGKGKTSEAGPVESTQDEPHNQRRCVRCAESNVQCYIPKGRRSCRRCVKLRKKCFQEEKYVDQRMALSAARGLEMINALQQATAALTENSQVIAENNQLVRIWTGEMKKVGESLVKERDRLVSQTRHKVEADDHKIKWE